MSNHVRSLLAAVALTAFAGPLAAQVQPKPLDKSGGMGGSLGAASAKAEDDVRYDCYAIDTERGEEIDLTVKSADFEPQIWIARGALCSSVAVQDQSPPSEISGEAQLRFKSAGGRYLVMTRASNPQQSGTYRIVVMRGGGFVPQMAEAEPETQDPAVEHADGRVALMNKQVAVRKAQLAEEARIKAEQERQRRIEMARAEEARRRAAEQAAAEDSGGGLFGRALGGFLMGAMMGGGGSNSMDMAIAGAQAAAQGGNALEVINSVGAASGVSGGSAIAGAAGMSGGGAFAAQPSALGGSGACGGMNESNYRQMGLSGGGDVQLKTMCAQSYELYNNYKNAVAQGYSEADIQRAYAAHQQSAMVVQQFYNETHDGSGGGIQQDTHGPQAPPPIVSGPSSSAPATPCHAPEGTSCVSPQ